MKLKTYKELIVWQKSITLVNKVYEITKAFPKQEVYILTSQMLRAAISIPSNIAEGYRRGHRPEFIQFLSISLASAAELETQVFIAKQQYQNLDYFEIENLLDEIQRMLSVMISRLKIKTQR